MTNLVKTSVKDDAKIFLTDYASYNNGTQFEFGHWVDLADFSDADELNDYIIEHFEECDEKSPLPCGTPREEIMITDYEGFPSVLYSESMNFEQLFNLFEYCEQNGIDSLENEGDNLVNLWNEYCQDNHMSDDEIFYFDDDNLLMLCGSNPMDIFNKGVNAQINWSDDYLVLDGYANIKSLSDPSREIDETAIIDWILETQI